MAEPGEAACELPHINAERFQAADPVRVEDAFRGHAFQEFAEPVADIAASGDVAWRLAGDGGEQLLAGERLAARGEPARLDMETIHANLRGDDGRLEFAWRGLVKRQRRGRAVGASHSRDDARVRLDRPAVFGDDGAQMNLRARRGRALRERRVQPEVRARVDEGVKWQRRRLRHGGQGGLRHDGQLVDAAAQL